MAGGGWNDHTFFDLCDGKIDASGMDDSCDRSDQFLVACFFRQHTALQLVFTAHLRRTSAIVGLRVNRIDCFARCHAHIQKSMARFFGDFIAAFGHACSRKDNGRHGEHLLWLRSIFLGDTLCVGLACVEFGIFVPGAESTLGNHIQTSINTFWQVPDKVQTY